MYGFFVNKYFIKVETGMIKNDVIGGPVYEGNSHDNIVGRICDYNPKNGMMKIELIEHVDYHGLLRNGIPLNHIVFNNKAR